MRPSCALASSALVLGSLAASATAAGQTLATTPGASAQTTRGQTAATTPGRAPCGAVARARERGTSPGDASARGSLGPTALCEGDRIMLAGAAVLNTSFAASFYTGLFAAAYHAPGEPGWLMVPFVGPFITAANYPSLQSPEAVLSLAAGVLECVGLGLEIVAAVVDPPWARGRAATGEARARAASWALGVAPTTQGLALSVTHF